jgi:hypothetical protein
MDGSSQRLRYVSTRSFSLDCFTFIINPRRGTIQKDCGMIDFVLITSLMYMISRHIGSSISSWSYNALHRIIADFAAPAHERTCHKPAVHHP